MKNRENTLKNAKLILCDIDGTLYDWSRVLSPVTFETIQQLHEKGYKIGLASGRPYEELCLYAKEWGFNFDFDVIIGLNGGEIYDLEKNQLFEYYKLSTDVLKEICEMMMRFTCNPFMYWHQKILGLHMDDMLIKSSKTSNREIVIANDLSDLYSEENIKIMFRMTEQEVKKVEEYLLEHPSNQYIGLKTQSTLIEFMDPRISKGFAVNELCKLGNYKKEEILAFGDTTNDNSMLQEAGWGVCLQNGSDDTKAIADEITELPCSKDGFAQYIRKNLL